MCNDILDNIPPASHIDFGMRLIHHYNLQVEQIIANGGVSTLTLAEMSAAQLALLMLIEHLKKKPPRDEMYRLTRKFEGTRFDGLHAVFDENHQASRQTQIDLENVFIPIYNEAKKRYTEMYPHLVNALHDGITWWGIDA